MRRGWHGRRGRPPWWPENEPFPPQGGQWRPMRRRFMRRVLLFATGAMLVFLAVLAVAIAALLRAFELAGPRGGWLVALVLAAGFAVVVFAGRGLRGFTAPETSSTRPVASRAATSRRACKSAARERSARSPAPSTP